MDIGAKLREIVKDIEAHLPGHPDAKVLSSMATEWSGRDLAAEDRAAYTEVPVGESVDLDVAQAQVTADTAADEELLAAPTESAAPIPPEVPAPEPAPAATP